MRPVLTTVLLFAASALRVHGCDYRDGSTDGDGYCITPQITATTQFTWAPLLTGTTKFVYAIDETTDPEAGDSSVAAFWLEHSGVSLQNNDLVMGTELISLFTNVSATTGGGSNGCESLLGNTCLDSLRNTLQDLWTTLPQYDLPLRNLQYHAATVSGCPSDLFHDFDLMNPRVDPLNGPRLSDIFFATEVPNGTPEAYPINADTAMPSGNALNTYSRQLRPGQPLQEQQKKAAVGILMRYPFRDGVTNPRTPTLSDVSITFVCAKPSGVVNRAEGAASVLGAPRGLVVAGLAGIALTLLGLW